MKAQKAATTFAELHSEPAEGQKRNPQLLPLEPGSTDTTPQRIPSVSTLSGSEVPSGAQNIRVWERMEERTPPMEVRED